MKKIKRGNNRITILLVCLILIFIGITILSKSVIATDPIPTAFYNPSRDSPVVGSTGNLASEKDFAVSLFTGAATYSYPISVPKGTNGLQPALSISYNHQSNSKLGIVGTAWSLTENYIQRDIAYTRNVTSDDKFKLILDGQEYDLVYDSSDGRYHTKIESYFYIQNVSGGNNTYNKYWMLKTKDGTNYRFGFNNNSEQVSNQENYTVRWYLDLVNDTYNNKIYYSYKENPNPGDAGVTYPYKIEYNNDKSREIEFVLESSNRPDTWVYYDQGNLINMTRRLKEIQIKTNNNLVRKYILDYDYLDTRSFLKEITLYGNDNSSKLYSNSFSYYTPQKGWYEVGSWKSPYTLSGDIDWGTRFADVNRDGYIDIVRGNKCCDDEDEEDVEIRINNKSGGWVIDSQSNFPYSITRTASYYICYQTGVQYGINRGIILVDLNGDGFEDLLVSPHDNTVGSIDRNVDNTAYLGYGNSSWYKNTSWASPTGRGWFVDWIDDWDFCKYYYGLDGGVRLLDFNGDGLIDIRRDILPKQWVNNKNGWTETSSWYLNEDVVYDGGRRPSSSCEWQRRFDLGVRFEDINGDGLSDVVISRDTSWGADVKKILINNGKEFVEVNWDIPEYFVVDKVFGDPICYTRYGVDPGIRVVDVNGDGLVDIVKSRGDDKKVYINKGTGWYLDNEWTFPTSIVTSYLENEGVRLVDVNGDGLVDIVKSRSYPNNEIKTWLNNASKGYLLKNIITQYGGVISIDYKKSTNLNNNGNDSISDIGFNVWVVANITEYNSMNGPSNVTSITYYNYSGGFYDYEDKEFRGFNYVEEKRPNISIVKHWFHQDDTLKGMEYKTEILNNQENPYQKIEYKWNYVPKNNYYINKLITETEYIYDGTLSNPKVTNKTFGYDNYGNFNKTSYFGDISKDGDEKYEYTEYVYNTNNWMVNKPKHNYLYGSDDTTKIRETKYYYDNLGYGQAPTKGSLTNIEEWLDTGNNPITNYSYDSYGNLIKETDANGHITNYTYGIKDLTYTFPDKVINARGHVTNYEYDLGTGNLLSEIDSNGYVINYTYDVFGRIKKEIRPYDNINYPTKEYEYGFDGIAPEKIKIMQREENNSQGTLDNYYFYDGFGKIIQIKREAENSKQIVSDVYYDDLERIKLVSNPYFIEYYENYTNPNQTVNKISYDYDPLDRVTKIVNPDGSQKNITHDHWTKIVYDENGHRKDYYLDAYGQIVNVIEHNNGEIYNTTYKYNPVRNLIEIKDNQSNVFSYVYDSLGRKISSDDPDLGIWNYTYDAVGNLIKQRDNKNITINMSYDELNRITYKNSSDENISYYYDTNLNSTLSKVEAKYITINYTYDMRLRKIKENKIIDGINFGNSLIYDSMDRIKSKTLPNGGIIFYNYSEQGKIDSINGILNDIDYNELDKPIKRIYGNNLNTEFTYDPKNFRLTRIKTGNKQDLNYNYDPVGNVLGINDTKNNRTYSMSYDDLDRLMYAEKIDDEPYYINFSYNSIGNMLGVVYNGIYNYYTLIFNYSNQKPKHAPQKIIKTGAIDVLDLKVISSSSMNKKFGFTISNKADMNLSNTNWILNTGETSITSQYNISLQQAESIFVYVDYDYRETGNYTVTATAYSGDLSDSQSINISVFFLFLIIPVSFFKSKSGKLKLMLLILIISLIIFIPFIVQSQNGNPKESILNENPYSTTNATTEKPKNGAYPASETAEFYYEDNMLKSGTIWGAKKFHDDSGEWKTITELVDFNKNGEDLILTYKNNPDKNLKIRPFGVYNKQKNYISDLSPEIKQQINLKNAIKQDRFSYKWETNFTKINNLEDFGFEVTDISNLNVNIVNNQIIIDDLIVIDFNDLIDTGYALEKNNNEIRISNLKSDFNNLDPTVVYYGQTKDGYLQKQFSSDAFDYNSCQSATPTIDTSSTTLRYGQQYANPSPDLYICNIWQGFWSFNTSAIPDSATISSSTLYTYVQNDYSTTSFNIQLRYSVTDWNTLGTEDWNWGSTNQTKSADTGNVWLNWSLNKGLIDKTGETQFAYRSDREGTEPSGNEYHTGRSADYFGTSYDPYINVTYSVPADEQQGRQAIEEAINNTITNADVYTDQQIYLVYWYRNQSKGKFDKVAVLNNQTWAFNYVTSGENYTNIQSIENTVNVWENSTLGYDEIVSQVEKFINSTKV